MLKDEERAHAKVEQRHKDIARSALYGVMGYLGISVMTDEAVNSVASRIADWESEQSTEVRTAALLTGIQLGLDRARRAIRAEFKPEEGTYHPLEIIIMYQDDDLRTALEALAGVSGATRSAKDGDAK